MKKLHILLAAALLVAFAGTSHAQSNILAGKALAGKCGGVGLDGRMKWVRGLYTTSPTQDSTRISIPGAAAAVDFADTTAWLDLNSVKFRNDYTQSPIVAFQINKQLTTTTDSIGYAVQYTNDVNSASLYGSTTVAYITTVSLATAGISAGQDGIVGTVVANEPKAAPTNGLNLTTIDFPYRYVRLVVLNSDTSGSTGRVYYSVTPVIFGTF